MNIQLFNFSVDLLQTILWQYNNAAKIQSLLQSKNEWYENYETDFWNDWYVNVFNLVTANEFGLSVWSIILGIPLFINQSADGDKPIWGFNEEPPINNYVNFDNGNFTGQSDVASLSIEEQRLLLRLRYYQLVTRGAIPEINTFLNELFQTSGTVYSGNAWALDGFKMTMVYVFDFLIPLPMLNILRDYDVLPRPAAVGIEYRILTGTIWGFNTDIPTTGFVNFDNGSFVPEF